MNYAGSRERVLAVLTSAAADFALLRGDAGVNVQFLLGVQTTGSYRFFVNVEALP